MDELCHELLAEAKKTADTINDLREENAKLKAAFDECYAANDDLFQKLTAMKAERDAAVGDLRDNGSCFFCKHFVETDYCERGCRWEWRGVQDEAE